MEEIKIVNAKGVECVVDSKSFELVQENKVLHDVKFETKTTTYAKDAFKRFCKNKSSIVAAIIIGLLLILAFTVPVISIHDLEVPHLKQRLLSPKLFKAGTGFWDGTKKYKDVIYDPKTESPAGFQKKSVVKYTDFYETYLDDFSEYSHGGIYVFEASKARREEGNYKFDYVKHANPITFTQENNVSFAVKFADLSEMQTDKNEIHEYRIVIQTNPQKADQYVVLKDWSDVIEDYEFNISEYLVQNGIDSLTGSVRFDVKTASTKPPYGSLYIESFVYSTTLDPEVEANQEFINMLDAISITDANAKQLLEQGEVGYWHSSGAIRVIKASVTYCSFIYNHYEDQLGAASNYEVGKSIMEGYINDGLCEYDFTVGPESFKALSQLCPIDKVVSQRSTTINGKEVINLVCDVQMYKILGFKTMPRFILGTDASGFDLFTRAFSSLRTSMGVAIIISAVCLSFGLVWGAISGYFGGNVDLAMERFCEILGGMPWIVLMTLVLIKWGQSIGTFAIASCITGWLGTAGITRTQFYRFKGREYILSSRTLGSSDIRLIFRHILPNALGTIVTASVLKIPLVIFSEATLSYLGLGLQGVQSFGVMLSENQVYVNSYSYLILFPAFIISLLMISFNLFGNGLRDALNPSLKGSD